jgi:SAM-dependent methyltransferase
MVSGYWISQAIYVAAELRIADRLGDSAMTADELADRTGTHAQSLYRLLRALASVGVFVEDTGHRFRGTPLSDCLKSDAANSQVPAVLMMVGQFYDAWGGLLSSIRSGEPAFKLRHGMSFFDHLTANPAEAQIFDAAMTALNDRKTTAFLDAYDLSDVSVLADVGGGNGSALVRILERYPALTGILFDLPSVVDRAKANLERSGLADRCRTVGGSFLDQVPSDADVYLLRHIIHNWDDEPAAVILANIHQAMAEGSKVVVVERIIPPGNEPSYGKFADLNMLILHGGLERTSEEFERLFEMAGFRLKQIVPTVAEVSVIEGIRRP